MLQTNNLIRPDQPIALYKPVLIGATLALSLIVFFLAGVDNPNPEWGKYWMVRPLIIVPLSGALGGLFFYFMDYMSFKGMNKTVAVLLSIVVYIIGLWMGTVLGLDGTLWN